MKKFKGPRLTQTGIVDIRGFLSFKKMKKVKKVYYEQKAPSVPLLFH